MYNNIFVIDVPNSGRKLVTLDKRLKWNPKFQELIKDLDSKKPVCIRFIIYLWHNSLITMYLVITSYIHCFRLSFAET